jgi:transcriptional regulator with XRE-family HTH domain
MKDTALLIRLRTSIAAEIRAEMARQNKTQSELAEAIRTTQATASYRLRGLNAFAAEELVLIADWLGVPVTQFLVLEPAEAVA